MQEEPSVVVASKSKWGPQADKWILSLRSRNDEDPQTKTPADGPGFEFVG